MKGLCILFVFFAISLSEVFGQSYGNEWINYSQQYYRIAVAEDGVYRVSYNTLVNAGIPIGSIDPRQFQIFAKGEEQYIYVSGEMDGIFHTSDYIEFYAVNNDGWFDESLYADASWHVDKDFSLYNDTAVYFLTWNTSLTNHRLSKETDLSFGSYTALPYFDYTSKANFSDMYYTGEPNGFNVTSCEYTKGEGWYGTAISFNDTYPYVNYNIPTPAAYLAGPPAEVNMVVFGASNCATLAPDHHLQITFAGQTLDTLFEGYSQLNISRTVPIANLGGTNTSFLFSILDDLNTCADRDAVESISIQYQRTPNLASSSELWFSVNDAVQAKSYFSFTNLAFSVPASDSIWVYDLSNHRRITTQHIGSTVKVLIPNSGAPKDCYLFVNSQVVNVNALSPVNPDAASYAKFTDYGSPTYASVNYIVVSHPVLEYMGKQYTNYRTATGYTSAYVNINELYDQFAFGIRKHPLAIRNFSRYALTYFADTIHGLFLIGKSYKSGGESYNYRQIQEAYDGTMVPTFGYPPSDNMFTSGIIDAYYTPAIPTGRLSARTNAEVGYYLQKMQDYEMMQNTPFNPSDPHANDWQKKVLHFAGGSSIGEANMLLSFLNTFRDTIQDPLFGGYVTTFTKTSSAPIQANQSDSLKDIINAGVTLLNFFGHAAGIGFDISIDNPSEYSNYQKYPFLIANSCFAGDLFTYDETSSEAFVLIENKGTIGYLGSITKSEASSLFIYSKELIDQISHTAYGQTIGYQIQQSIQRVQNPSNIFLKEVCQEMTLHGDPVLRINAFPKPDYYLTASDVYFNPIDVSNEVDSFDMHVIVFNAGSAVNDSIVVEISRNYPDNTSHIYQKTILAPSYSDTLTVTMPVNISSGLGINMFTITVDAFDQVDESVETNNTVMVSLFIKSSDIVPVYPAEFAVLPDTMLTLIASTGYAFSGTNSYVFEIDTTDAFNSPFLQSSSPIISAGGIVEWALPFSMLSMPDSTVYFWRVAIQGSGNWRESSFQYITGKRGWGQAHFYQFKKDDYEYVSYNKPSRIFEFVNNIIAIDVQTGYYIWQTPNYPYNEEWYKVNGAIRGQYSCTNYNGDGMKFAVFDTITGQPWVSINDFSGYGQYGNLHCRAYDYTDMDFFTTDSSWMARMVHMIDTVPDGFWVLAFSHRNHNAENYTEELYQAFESIGSGNIRSITNGLPYYIFGRKGSLPGTAEEGLGTNQIDLISDDFQITTNWNVGYVESTLIGPSNEWGSLHWRLRSYEAGVQSDTSRLYVIGFRADMSSDTVIASLTPTAANQDIYNLGSLIDANEFPYIKLHLKTQDDSLHTPAQLIRWQVLYDEVPETAIDPASCFIFYNDTVQEGEDIKLSIATRNISHLDFADSLMVSYWVVDQNRVQHPLLTHVTRLHPSGDVLIDSVRFSTFGFPGLNSLWVEFNPINPSTGYYDQLELHHFNNIGEIKFLVDKDRINPILDVTFDGIHIMDGDIVSALPDVSIMLKDENRYLLLNDTSDFKIYLIRPGSTELERLFFSPGGIEFMRFDSASNGQNNVCRIDFTGNFMVDGVYTLMVQAKDKSDNESGAIDYQIRFEVINKPAITDVMNWPNPFSTRTHFVFTLTGSEVPQYMTIQIMTVTGRVVREIDVSELGPIHIGRNITEYAWDGRDEYGDQLANGVYLYRVIVRLNGQEMEKMEDNPAAQYFTKEFGKMMLIR